MKVIVCFEDTNVIVPCGDGELTVLELINKAVKRYCKAKYIVRILQSLLYTN